MGIVYGGGQTTHKLPDGASLSSYHTDVCNLCQDDVDDSADDEDMKRVAKCGHAFHDSCIRAYISDAPPLPSGGIGCPTCFTKLSIELDDVEAGSDEEEKDTSGRPQRRALVSASATLTKKQQRSPLPAFLKGKKRQASALSASSKEKKCLASLPAPSERTCLEDSADSGKALPDLLAL